MCYNVSEVCRISYLETFCEKKIREKITGKKLQAGVATIPLGGGGLNNNVM